MKISALTGPMGPNDSQVVELHVERGGAWQSFGEAKLDPDAWVATFRLAIIVELVAWAFSLAGASFFPALVMGIWWKRANKAGAVTGMIAGLLVTAFYMIGSRFYGLSWFGTATIASAVFGLPVGFLLYIADRENHCIRVADLKAGTVSTVAGTGTKL